MGKVIERYAFFWNVRDNEGTLQLQFSDGSGDQVLVDSPQEGLLLLDVLRNEKPVFYDAQHKIVMTGLESVGEGEDVGGRT